MQDLEFVRTYIDDLLAITKGSFDAHLQKLDVVLARLNKAGLKVDAKKSFVAQSELEYLGQGWHTTNLQESQCHQQHCTTKDQEATLQLHWHGELLSGHVDQKISCVSALGCTNLQDHTVEMGTKGTGVF